jgi:hypothetical protein
MKPDVGRTPCKRNDSFFENAGKLYESTMMMWIKFRRHLHSHDAAGATAKPLSQRQTGQNPDPIGAQGQWKMRATQPATHFAPAVDRLAHAGRIVIIVKSRQHGADACRKHAHW